MNLVAGLCEGPSCIQPATWLIQWNQLRLRACAHHKRVAERTADRHGLKFIFTPLRSLQIEA